jgi:hypothetical protein
VTKETKIVRSKLLTRGRRPPDPQTPAEGKRGEKQYRSLLLLFFRGQPLTPLGAAPDAENNASLLLTKILNSVKRKSLILKGRPYRTLFLKFFIFPGGTPWNPPPPFAALAFSI